MSAQKMIKKDAETNCKLLVNMHKDYNLFHWTAFFPSGATEIQGSSVWLFYLWEETFLHAVFSVAQTGHLIDCQGPNFCFNC